MVNGEKLNPSLPILNINGRTMYHFRECLESMGAQVEWVPETRTARGALGDKAVEFTVDSVVYKSIEYKSIEYTYSGTDKGTYTSYLQMDKDVTAFINEGRTYIPLRYAGEALGFHVAWDFATSTIDLNELRVLEEPEEEPEASTAYEIYRSFNQSNWPSLSR